MPSTADIKPKPLSVIKNLVRSSNSRARENVHTSRNRWAWRRGEEDERRMEEWGGRGEERRRGEEEERRMEEWGGRGEERRGGEKEERRSGEEEERRMEVWGGRGEEDGGVGRKRKWEMWEKRNEGGEGKRRRKREWKTIEGEGGRE